VLQNYLARGEKLFDASSFENSHRSARALLADCAARMQRGPRLAVPWSVHLDEHPLSDVPKT
jgi:hypothetical protein